jgi:phosphoesterase RecJ-like protein
VRADWDAVVERLRAADSVALACHVGPDGDALGSMLALGLALRSLGKQVVASWGGEPFEVPASYGFLPGLDLLVPATRFPAAPELLVTLDTGSADRLGSLADRVQTAGCCIVVDHHASNTCFGGSTWSTGTPRHRGAGRRAGRPARACRSPRSWRRRSTPGLITDTGDVPLRRHHAVGAPAGGPAAGHRHPARRHRPGHLRHRAVRLRAAARGGLRAGLARGRRGRGLGMVWTAVPAEDLVAAKLGLADVEGVIDVLRTRRRRGGGGAQGRPGEGGWKVSLRSKGSLDVGALCTALGGGGHRFAAGFSTDESPSSSWPGCARTCATRRTCRGERAGRRCWSSTSPRAGPRTTWSAGCAGWPGPARSATPARWTRWPPACWSSGSAGPPGCSATWR